MIGLADSLVQIKEAYRDVASSLLGRILVVDTMDHAVRIAGKYDHSIRMVTLEGELFVPGGAISGGAFKNSSNLLGRRREIRELEERVAGCLEKTKKIQQDIENIKEERNCLRKELETTRQMLQERFIEQNTTRLNVIAAEEKWNATEQGFGSLQEEQEEIARQIRQIGEDKEKTTGELTVSEELEREVQAQIREYQSVLEAQRMEESRQTAQVSEWEVQAEKFRQQQKFKQQNLDRIDGEIGRLSAELAEIEAELGKNAEEIVRKQADIHVIQKTISHSRISGD